MQRVLRAVPHVTPAAVQPGTEWRSAVTILALIAMVGAGAYITFWLRAARPDNPWREGFRRRK
jgi:hypothetical protein